MDASLRLRSVQHDKVRAWMLGFAQHDKKGECAPFSMTKPTVSFRA